MTDRELLELAAKAAGLKIVLDFGNSIDASKLGIAGVGVWNPLTDDGDALRLAVKAHIEFRRIHDIARADAMGCAVCIEDAGIDEYAATRRAIVRAAAEIGRAMP